MFLNCGWCQNLHMIKKKVTDESLTSGSGIRAYHRMMAQNNYGMIYRNLTPTGLKLAFSELGIFLLILYSLLY